MRKFKKYLYLVMLLLCVLIGGVWIAFHAKNDKVPEEKSGLSLNKITLVEDGAYSFDHFLLGDSYDKMEERIQLTNHGTPKIRTIEGVDYENTTEVTCMLELNDYGNAAGRIIYSFYDNRFIKGSVKVNFSSYEDAVNCVNEMDQELRPLQLGEITASDDSVKRWCLKSTQETWEDGYLYRYIDANNVYIQVSIMKDSKGNPVLDVVFMENVLKGKSSYFDIFYTGRNSFHKKFLWDARIPLRSVRAKNSFTLSLAQLFFIIIDR